MIVSQRMLLGAVLLALSQYRVGCDGCGTPRGPGDGGIQNLPDGGAVGGGGGSAGGVGRGEVCTDGWCWENPKPAGATLWALWAQGPGDVWAAGEAGLVFHFSNGAVTSYTLPHDGIVTIGGLADDGAGRLVAVASDGQLHVFDGGWTSLDAGAGWELEHVFCAGAGLPCYATGSFAPGGPAALSWFPGALPVPLFMNASSSPWVIGVGGTQTQVLFAFKDGHFDVRSIDGGASGAPPPSVPLIDGGLTGFCVQPDGGLWAASNSSFAGWFFGGSAWAQVPLPLGNFGAGCADDGVLFVGNPFAGHNAVSQVWRCTPGSCSAEDVDAGYTYPQGFYRHYPSSLVTAFVRGGDAWVSGEGGAVFESLSGAPWRSLTSGPRESSYDVWIDSDGGGWASGQNGGVLRRDKGTWSVFDTMGVFGALDVYRVEAGPTGGYMFAVAASGLWSLPDGQAPFVHLPEVFPDGGPFGAGYTWDLEGPWAVDQAGGSGIGSALRWDGAHWVVIQQFAGDPQAIFVTDAGTAWFGGFDSQVLHFDGTAFQPVALPGTDGTEPIYGIVGTSDDDVFIVSPQFAYHHLPDGGWDVPVSFNTIFQPNGFAYAVLDVPRATLWVAGMRNGGFGTDVLALTDAGMQVTELSLDAVLSRLRLQNNALWLVGPAGDVLRHDLP
jgi:hypothetical protein